jgi:RNA polymerase sigma-70 factor (ECF subfamily)
MSFLGITFWPVLWGFMAAMSETLGGALLAAGFLTRLAAFVRPMLDQPDMVEDVVQMVMIKLCRRISRLREPITFEPWLFTLARNAALDSRRRVRCRPTGGASEEQLANMPASDSTMAVRDILEALESALPQLAPADQEIVGMVVSGASYRAIADKMQLSLGAVKIRLNRARKILRQCMSVSHEIARPRWAA